MTNKGGRGRRTPTNILDLTGRLQHDKKRFLAQGRDREPVEERPLGDAPAEELLTFAEAWALVVDQCPAGVLRRRDRALVQLAASLLQETNNYRVLAGLQGHISFGSPGYMKALAQLSAALSKLGMTPVDASKVQGAAPPAPPKNDFDD